MSITLARPSVAPLSEVASARVKRASNSGSFSSMCSAISARESSATRRASNRAVLAAPLGASGLRPRQQSGE